jgi:hypothetical protein
LVFVKQILGGIVGIHMCIFLLFLLHGHPLMIT